MLLKGVYLKSSAMIALALLICPLSVMADDPTSDVLRRRIASFREQVQSLDGQIGELNRRMSQVENAIEKLTEKCDSLTTTKSEAKTNEPANSRPQQVGFRPPILRTVKKDTPLAIVCQNKKIAMLDLDECEQAFKALAEDKSKLQALVEGKDATMPAGDFEIKISFQKLGNDNYLVEQEVFTKPGQAGETIESVLEKTSRLNMRLAKINPDKAVIQFVVYPDSFDVFRKCRQLVWEQKFGVNWIPLEHGTTIGIGGGGVQQQ